MIYEIYFSATGRTKKVANIISSVWQEKKEVIDLTVQNFTTNPINLSCNDLAIVCVPSYGGRVPQVAIERLKFIFGNEATALMVVVYGNRAIDDTLLELKDILTKQGFSCCGAIEAIAEHSMMTSFAVGRPDEKDEVELKNFARKFNETLESNKLSGQLNVPGKYPYVKLMKSPVQPKANKNCIKCGICANECPVKAIPKDNPNKTIKSKCITCMRCVEICPKRARNLSKFMISLSTSLMKNKMSGRKENKLYL